MLKFWNLNYEDMKTLVIESGYNPVSTRKEERKLSKLVSYLKDKGYDVTKEDFHPFSRKEDFWTVYYLRIFNPKVTEEDDQIWYDLELISM